MKVFLFLLIGLVLMGIGIPSERPRARTLEQTGEVAVVTHIGVVVHDVEQSARAYAAIVGIDPPPIRPADPGRGAGSAQTAQLRLSNISIELIQPGLHDDNSLRQILDVRGPGVHHIGLRQDQDHEADDLTDPLGLMIEYDAIDSEPASVTESRLERPTCVTHIGIAVRDILQARQALAGVLGVETPAIREFEEVRGRAQFTVFALDNVSIELLQQVDTKGGTYADFVEPHGPRAHHLGLHLRGTTGSLTMPEQLAWLEQHDGAMAVNAGGFAYVDMRPQLGLFIEALPTATNERVYPHPHPGP